MSCGLASWMSQYCTLDCRQITLKQRKAVPVDLPGSPGAARTDGIEIADGDDIQGSPSCRALAAIK
jgi:hypothetical protein